MGGVAKQLHTSRRADPSRRTWADKRGTPAMIELGNRIRERRLAAGLTAEQAARRAGNYHKRTWWHWEAGERAMAVEQLLSICSLFDVPIGVLCADLDIPAARAVDPDLQRASMALLNDYWQLPERERRAVKRVVKALLRRERRNYEVMR